MRQATNETETKARVYPSKEDRDEAVDATYDLDPTTRAACDIPPGVPIRRVDAILISASQALAELFWREMPAVVGTIAEKLALWSQRRIGRDPEPVVRGVLRFQVGRLESDRPRRRPGHELFETYAEQRRYQRAAADVERRCGPWKGGADQASLDRVKLILEAAKEDAALPTWPRGMGGRDRDDRLATLREQVAAITQDRDAPEQLKLREPGEDG